MQPRACLPTNQLLEHGLQIPKKKKKPIDFSQFLIFCPTLANCLAPPPIPTPISKQSCPAFTSPNLLMTRRFSSQPPKGLLFDISWIQKLTGWNEILPEDPLISINASVSVLSFIKKISKRIRMMMKISWSSHLKVTMWPSTFSNSDFFSDQTKSNQFWWAWR